MAQEGVVCSSPQNASGGSTEATPYAGSPLPAWDEAPEPRLPRASGMEAERARLRAQGVSEEAITTIQGARAKSTSQRYGGQWQAFIRWCDQRGVDPDLSSLAEVINFLQEKFEGGTKWSTLKVYVAAIGAYHPEYREVSLGSRPEIRAFIRWCDQRGINPDLSGLADMINFLQEKFEGGTKWSTLKVYVAAIGAYHPEYREVSLG